VKRALRRLMSGNASCGRLGPELVDAFNLGNANEFNALVLSACENADEPNNDPTASFYDILDDTVISRTGDNVLSAEENESRFLKEFYDGNTFINEEVKANFNPMNRQIQSFYRNAAKSQVVEWPDDSIDNFDSCELNTVMCCWVTDRRADNDGDCAEPYPGRNGFEGSNCVDADPADNTDLCYVDHQRSPQANHVDGGFILYPEETEGPTHCHGFIWSDDDNDESSLYKANNLFYVSMYDHLRNRGYVRNVPGAPMCGCLEQMPTVSRSDCTQTEHQYYFSFSYAASSADLVATAIGRRVEFNACDGETANDLESKYQQMVDNDEIADQTGAFSEIVVGDDGCSDAIEDFMGDKGFQKVA